MMQHDYITLKLTNGDTLITVLIDEDDNRFVVMYPIQMKTVSISINGTSKETMAGTPWCSFTDHKVFQIWKSDVIMIKPLNDSTIDYYKRLVDLSEIEDELEDIDDDYLDDYYDGSETLH